MPGPVGQYTFKYNLKDTQEDDEEKYKRVKARVCKTLSDSRRYESDASESIRRLLSAAHAHQKKNILHGTMASYLVRNKTRFIFSHNTVWCPMRDLESILTDGEVQATIVYNHETPFFQTSALHYLCRPLELQDVSVHDFYSEFAVVRVTSTNEDTLLPFLNHKFQHPSFQPKKGRFVQGVTPRERPYLVKVFQYDFPDTAEFGGSILDYQTPVTEVTELYAKLALLLFCPFHELGDLLTAGSYTLRFREAVTEGTIGEDDRTFLQNIQDARSNCFRLSKLDDDLQRDTQKYQPANVQNDNSNDNENDERDDDLIEGPELDALLDMFDQDNSTSGGHQQRTGEHSLPSTFKLDNMRQKGVLKCGYENLAAMNFHADTSSCIYETTRTEANAEASDNDQDASCEDTYVRQKAPNRRQIGQILLTRTKRRRRTFKDITGNDREFQILAANGSVSSILDWARKAELDSGQRRAFEIFAGTFVLTFFDEEKPDPTAGRGE